MTVFGAHKSKIIKSSPGEIAFKLTLDTVFVNSSAISVKNPILILIKHQDNLYCLWT